MTDNELELYFRQMNELFHTEGWKTLVKDLSSNIPIINSVESTKDDKDLYFRKGQLYTKLRRNNTNGSRGISTRTRPSYRSIFACIDSMILNVSQGTSMNTWLKAHQTL